MNAERAITLVGKVAEMLTRAEGLTVRVVVISIRPSVFAGRWVALVTPVSGRGRYEVAAEQLGGWKSTEESLVIVEDVHRIGEIIEIIEGAPRALEAERAIVGG
jgi:hypothetical protein